MDSQASISYYMLQDHNVLDGLLQQVLDVYTDNPAQARRFFTKFKEQLEKHLQTEEQAIFSFSNLGDMEVMQTVRELLVEHGTLRGYLEDIALDLMRERPSDSLEAFVKLLGRHRAIEGDVLYPKLDQDLKNDEKKYIINKINSLRK